MSSYRISRAPASWSASWPGRLAISPLTGLKEWSSQSSLSPGELRDQLDAMKRPPLGIGRPRDVIALPAGNGYALSWAVVPWVHLALGPVLFVSIRPGESSERSDVRLAWEMPSNSVHLLWGFPIGLILLTAARLIDPAATTDFESGMTWADYLEKAGFMALQAALALNFFLRILPLGWLLPNVEEALKLAPSNP